MGHVTSVYLDTNAFILLAETAGETQKALADLVLAPVRNNSPWFVSSELTLAELLVKPLAAGNTALVELYEFWLSPSPWLDVTPVGRDVLRYAARLRAVRRSLKLPDAIHAATCLLRGCGALISDDRDLDDGLPLPSPAHVAPDIVRLDAGSLRLLRTKLLSP